MGISIPFLLLTFSLHFHFTHIIIQQSLTGRQPIVICWAWMGPNNMPAFQKCNYKKSLRPSLLEMNRTHSYYFQISHLSHFQFSFSVPVPVSPYNSKSKSTIYLSLSSVFVLKGFPGFHPPTVSTIFDLNARIRCSLPQVIFHDYF